ncbi:hypothetical protein MLD38_018971 [Melastoma candidum]|uniref:Uncharacterized protein n=1 Tax=Melastoma candidum TaxID=119954 RepID=A0ACB9QVI1_9MYRT|nr:hypothetical protein MLD38_018971 [Melastoma candidum]
MGDYNWVQAMGFFLFKSKKRSLSASYQSLTRKVSSSCGEIKRKLGRPAFDEFLKKYIDMFKFKSIDTETSLEFLKANIHSVLWTEGVGKPPADAYEPVFTIYTQIVSLANEFKSGRMPREDEVADWQGQHYFENLPKSVEASLVLPLDARYKLATSKCYELKVAFL